MPERHAPDKSARCQSIRPVRVSLPAVRSDASFVNTAFNPPTTLWTSTPAGTSTFARPRRGQLRSGRIGWHEVPSNTVLGQLQRTIGSLIVCRSIRPAQVRATVAGRLIWHRTPERQAPGQPALHATACLYRRRCSPAERRPARTSPSSLRKVARPGLPAQPSCRVPEGAAASGAGAHARTCRTATYRPGSGPDSEHVAEYAGTSAPVVLLLLHDFPNPGRFPAFPC